jgi:hypothetical protein
VERVTGCTPKSAAISGSIFWSAAIIVFVVHIAGIWTSARGFAITDTWLVAGGSLGMPVFPLRALGRHLTPAVCLTVVAFMFGCGILLTGLTVAGEMRPTPVDAAFGLILFVAPAIQAYNTLDTLMATQRAYRTGAEDTRQVLCTDFDTRLQRAETAHADREAAQRVGHEADLQSLRQQLAEAQAAAEQRYNEGIDVGIEACRLEIQRRADHPEDAATPLAEIVALQSAKASRPLRVVRDADTAKAPRLNGHEPANHTGS